MEPLYNSPKFEGCSLSKPTKYKLYLYRNESKPSSLIYYLLARTIFKKPVDLAFQIKEAVVKEGCYLMGTYPLDYVETLVEKAEKYILAHAMQPVDIIGIEQYEEPSHSNYRAN